jgi:hypothetical protein
MAKAVLKLYGERNTGTNYVHKLLAANLDVHLLRGVPPRVLNVAIRSNKLPYTEKIQDTYHRLSFRYDLGWKHAFAPSPSEIVSRRVPRAGLRFVTVSKNPYAWVLSLYRKPYNYYPVWETKPSFEEFLVSPPPFLERERAPVSLRDPVDVWNRKNASYFGLSTAFPTANLRYEEVLDNPQTVVEGLGVTLGIPMGRGEFENHERSTKDRGKDFSYYRDYYLQRRWREQLNPEQIELINERLDRSIVERLGYELL